MNIGSKIREFRKKNKLTMKELGKLVGVSEQAISQYERNIRNINIDMLLKIAAALNVSIDTFIKINDFETMDKIIEERKSIDNLLMSYGFKVHHISLESLNEKGNLIIKEDGCVDSSKNPHYTIESDDFGTIIFSEDDYEDFVNNIETLLKFELYKYMANSKKKK